ncbi:hypothetical protein SFUMM280S_06015 [Streptomyces fumanus]
MTGGALEVVRADLTDPEALRPAVAGRDAVLSGLGAGRRKDAGVAARLTRTVLAAMAAEGVRRPGGGRRRAGLGPVPEEGALDRGLRTLVSAVLRDVYADLREMAGGPGPQRHRLDGGPAAPATRTSRSPAATARSSAAPRPRGTS